MKEILKQLVIDCEGISGEEYLEYREAIAKALADIKKELLEKLKEEALPTDRGNIAKQRIYNQALADCRKVVEEA